MKKLIFLIFAIILIGCEYVPNDWELRRCADACSLKYGNRWERDPRDKRLYKNCRQMCADNILEYYNGCEVENE